MTIRRLLLAIFVATALVCVSTPWIGRTVSANPQPLIPEFAVSFEEKYFSLDGKQSGDPRFKTIGIRGDGAMITINRSKWKYSKSAVPSGFFEYRVIVNPAAKTLTVVYPDLRMKTTVPLSEMEVRRHLPELQGDCQRVGWVSDEKLDTSIGGVRTIFQSRESSSTAASVSTKEWKAPALHCITLRREKVTRLGQQWQRTELRAVDVVMRAPDDALFQVSSDWPETVPSAVLVALERLKGKECSECLKKTGARADEMYERQWKRHADSIGKQSTRAASTPIKR